MQTIPSSSLPPESTLTPPIGSPPSVIPLAAKYPLELLTVQGEIESFFKIEDLSKRTFPSLYDFRKPQNLDEYLKMKVRQAEMIAREDSKGLGNREYQGQLSHELSKVRKLADFAKNLSKSMSERPIDTELEKELRVDYIDHVMKHKPYKATRSQFKDWSSDALMEEIDRITKMNNDPMVKKTPPNGKKAKQVDPDEALKFKRMRVELVAVDYASTRSIAIWSKLNIEETYKKLEELRAEDPIVPQKPVYPTTTAGRPQQTQTSKKLHLTSTLPANALNQLKRQKKTHGEDEQRFEEYRKEAIKCQIEFHMDDAADQLTAQLTETIKRLASRPQSPNASLISLVPRKPFDPKILKWNSSSNTHILTLLRSNDDVERIKMKDAYGLNACDLQYLFKLQLERDDEENMISLDFELQFKGQIREMLIRNKDQK
ncbi:hypothetical protein HanRHA438_Chr08g0352131 [Helianthus annuus]|nr:hypothetical protein HanRHA438_Chr08g0352131 [Helianthus annuus]